MKARLTGGPRDGEIVEIGRGYTQAVEFEEVTRKKLTGEVLQTRTIRYENAHYKRTELLCSCGPQHNEGQMSSHNHVELKGAQVRLAKAKAELNVAYQEKRDIEERIATLRCKATAIEKEVQSLQTESGVLVSEHAMLRYLERVMHLDLDKIKEKMLTPDVVKAVDHFHGGEIPHTEGYTLCVRENVVTTVVTEDSKEP